MKVNTWTDSNHNMNINESKTKAKQNNLIVKPHMHTVTVNKSRVHINFD